MILDSIAANVIILVCCIIGLVYAIVNAYLLSKVHIWHSHRRVYEKFEDEEAEMESIPDNLTEEVLEIASYIERVKSPFKKSIFLIIIRVPTHFSLKSTNSSAFSLVSWLWSSYLGLNPLSVSSGLHSPSS